jgi:hypothetical protein
MRNPLSPSLSPKVGERGRVRGLRKIESSAKARTYLELASRAMAILVLSSVRSKDLIT